MYDNVFTIKLDGKRTVVNKIIKEMDDEPLIHEQLWEESLRVRGLSQMIPRPYGLEPRLSGRINMYMERIYGSDLIDVIEDMEKTDVLSTLIAVHSFLAHMKRRIGFEHADLSIRNIVLRGYGGDEIYSIPIITRNEVKYIEMSFCPVIIDYGNSVTNRYCTTWSHGSPLSTDLIDVWVLYNGVRNRKGVLLQSLDDDLTAVFGDEWYRRFIFPIPMPLICEQLTHEAILERYLTESGVLR